MRVHTNESLTNGDTEKDLNEKIIEGAPIRKKTAKHVFERVADRVGMDAKTLAYLFSECLVEVIKEADAVGICLIRGVAKLRKVQLPERRSNAVKTVDKPADKPAEPVLVLDVVRAPLLHRPFAEQKLTLRAAKHSGASAIPQSTEESL